MGSVWQNAPAWWLEEGNFDGITPVSALRERGDLGIGAFDHLDGEMVGVDGVFYRVADGFRATPAPDDATVPFCMVTRFSPSERFELPSETTKESLGRLMEDRFDEGSFYTLRVDARLAAISVRYLPRQERPYPTLAEVAGTEPETSYEHVEGTMIGFRAPSYTGRIAPGGYHLHFLSADRSFGGHVLGFELAEAEIAVERIETQSVDYPTP